MREFLKEFLSENNEKVYTLMFLAIITVVSSLVFYKIDGDISNNLLNLNMIIIGGLIGDKVVNSFKG